MSRRMSVARCRSCWEEIIWATTRSGKKMPLDAEPHDQGTFEIREWRYGEVTAHYLGEHGEYASGYRGPRYNSHFSTCPHTHRMSK